MTERKTILGTEATPCPRHGWEDIGVLTGLCLACDREIDRVAYWALIDGFLAMRRTAPPGDDTAPLAADTPPARPR